MWRNMIAVWIKELQFYQSWDDWSFTCWACEEQGSGDSDMNKHMISGCNAIHDRMKRYAKTHPDEREPDMERWLLTVPGSPPRLGHHEVT